MSRSTATKSSQTAKPTKAGSNSQPTNEQTGCDLQTRIAMLAYQKWVAGGCQHGKDQQDWLEAEAEIQSQIKK